MKRLVAKKIHLLYSRFQDSTLFGARYVFVSEMRGDISLRDRLSMLALRNPESEERYNIIQLNGHATTILDHQLLAVFAMTNGKVRNDRYYLQLVREEWAATSSCDDKTV